MEINLVGDFQPTKESWIFLGAGVAAIAVGVGIKLGAEVIKQKLVKKSTIDLAQTLKAQDLDTPPSFTFVAQQILNTNPETAQ